VTHHHKRFGCLAYPLFVIAMVFVLYGLIVWWYVSLPVLAVLTVVLLVTARRLRP
jgi:hypothetical protein